MTDTVLEADGLTFGYGATPVVRDVDLSVADGEFVGVVGPNGSGKSTLLQLLLGLHEPDDGTATLFGEPARSFEQRDRVGYVAQDARESGSAVPITVEEVALMGRFPHAGFAPVGDEDRRLARDALRTVGIDHLADRRIGRLSGGQRQRAYVARALAAQADLLVLDEPTVGVDAESVEEFFDLLEELNRRGVTILLVEHDLGVVARRTDRVVCLDTEVYFDGPPEAFAESDAIARAYGTDVLQPREVAD